MKKKVGQQNSAHHESQSRRSRVAGRSTGRRYSQEIFSLSVNQEVITERLDNCVVYMSHTYGKPGIFRSEGDAIIQDVPPLSSTSGLKHCHKIIVFWPPSSGGDKVRPWLGTIAALVFPPCILLLDCMSHNSTTHCSLRSRSSAG